MTKMIMAHLIVDFDGIVVDGTTKVIPKANGKSGNHTYSESVTSKQAKAGIGISSSCFRVNHNQILMSVAIMIKAELAPRSNM